MIQNVFKRYKEFYIYVVTIMAFFAVSFSCMSGNNYDDSIHIVKEEGWINDTTFSVAAFGKPKAGSSSRKSSSQLAAIISAKKQIIAHFRKLQRKMRSSRDYTKSNEAQIKYDTQNLQNALANGTLLHIRFDGEDNCEILFVVQQPQIRKFILGANLNRIETAE